MGTLHKTEIPAPTLSRFETILAQVGFWTLVVLLVLLALNLVWLGVEVLRF